MFSNGCEYAMQAVVFLAMTEEERPFVPIRRIGERLGISPAFLAKVLRRLTERGLLCAQRGPGGGVALGRPPEQITLKDIVLAVDGAALFESCVLGLAGCGDRAPCPLHEAFGPTRDRLAATFERITVAALAGTNDAHNPPTSST